MTATFTHDFQGWEVQLWFAQVLPVECTPGKPTRHQASMQTFSWIYSPVKVHIQLCLVLLCALQRCLTGMVISLDVSCKVLLLSPSSASTQWPQADLWTAPSLRSFSTTTCLQPPLAELVPPHEVLHVLLPLLSSVMITQVFEHLVYKEHLIMLFVLHHNSLFSKNMGFLTFPPPFYFFFSPFCFILIINFRYQAWIRKKSP